MAEPKNSQKGGRTGPRTGSDPKEGNYEKGKTRDKYRTTIPKQANQMSSKSQMADPQRPHHRGNHNDIEKTLTDTQLAEPTRTMDERGNDETIPDSSGKSLMQQTELSQQCCYSPEEEEELRELEMQMQNIEDGHNSDPYLEHMKADRIVQIKNTMEYIIDELEQIKEENPWEKLGYAAGYRKLSALNGNAEWGQQT